MGFQKRNMKILFFGLLELCFSISCPSGWVEEDRYCLKYLPIKAGIFKAREKCKELGATIFLPKSFSEHKSLNQLAKNKFIDGYDFKNSDFWLPLKVADLTKRGFPPNVMLPNKQPAPEWFHQTDPNVQKQMVKLWSRKSKKWI